VPAFVAFALDVREAFARVERYFFRPRCQQNAPRRWYRIRLCLEDLGCAGTADRGQGIKVGLENNLFLTLDGFVIFCAYDAPERPFAGIRRRS
jgi:hypothetical protein